MLLLAFALSFTLPRYEAVYPDSCNDAAGAPEDHIAYVICYDADTGEALSKLQTWDYAPGTALTWNVEVFGPHRVCVRAFDERENGSCPSAAVEVDGGPTPFIGVPQWLGPMPVRREFDVMGRRAERWEASGWRAVRDSASGRVRRTVRVR